MSIVKIPPERIERFSLTLHPEVDYLSSSANIDSLGIKEGTSGSAPLRRRPSRLIKDLVAPHHFGELNNLAGAQPLARAFNEGDYEMIEALHKAKLSVRAANLEDKSKDVSSVMAIFLSGVNQSPNPVSNTKRVYATRFDPPFSLNDVAIEKSVIQENLMTFYESRYDLCEMAYTNYHTLNFFSANEGEGLPGRNDVDRIPDSSAIIYQNFTTSSDLPRPYSPSGSFSMDFYINPRYSNVSGTAQFRAGTILHLSSTFCLSLVSGTSRDGNGLVDGYRLMLQLSHSADLPPSSIAYDADAIYPRDLVFLTADNSLTKNRWHHCTVRWGTKTLNNGTGSIHIDDKVTSFAVPSSSILPPKNISNAALIVGNYFNGNSNEAQFFNKSTESEGVSPVLDFGFGFNVDPIYTMNHPLNAEIHELKLFKKFISSDEIRSFGETSVTSFSDLMFYVPPFFIPDVKAKDMLITPFQKQVVRSPQPFNETFSFGVGGFVMNLENHVKDFVTNNMPRCLNLTASTIDTTVIDISATSYCYNTGSIKKRNLTILPNDNGRFKPDYSLVATASGVSNAPSRMRKHGSTDLSVISLVNMVSEDKIFTGLPTTTVADMEAVLDGDADTLPDDLSEEAIAALLAGVTPESMGGTSGPILTVAQRTRDRSSNEICFFDISNLYYGDQIKEDSLYLIDPSLTGSDGRIKMTLRDNGRGGMYRCDAEGPHPYWSNVGNALYKEGIVVVKSPILTFFGKDCFELNMKGEQNVHVSMINIPLEAGMFNSSSNPMYQELSASASPADMGKKYVYIDSLNIHDENLNVIARTNFSQPIKKRVEDSMLLRFKMDF